MSDYTTDDLEYSLAGGTSAGGLVEKADVKRVVAAWGVSGREHADWTGGFILELRDGRYAYLDGWSDSSGWGCQDGASVAYFDALPDRSMLDYGYTKPEDYGGWDEDPADLNLWLLS